VLELDGEQVAVYKDSAGHVTRLSPLCPHQGCAVQWNASSSTWVCPCHGSRFEPEGARISGPAEKGLDKVG
jgi:Rieske Fe-S protein